MIAGSCLLAFTFGVLWRLFAPPRPVGTLWPGRLAALRSGLGWVDTGGVGRRVALTHRELCINRT